jgi:hypothetical protein
VAGAALFNGNGVHAGSPYITVNAGSLAPGASLTVPTVFTKTGAGSVTYSVIKIYSGNF